MRKRSALILLTALSLLVLHPEVGWAQQGLNVNRIFQQYGHAKGYKMVEMNDAKLKGYALHVYKSLVFKRQNAQIDEWLGLDRKRARKIREVVQDGKVTSGYYMMPPLDGYNRYILFSKNGRGGGAVIFIEGHLSPDDILKLCYNRN